MNEPFLASAITLALNQHRLLIKARRLTANGEIIICDRYSSDIVGAMDVVVSLETRISGLYVGRNPQQCDNPAKRVPSYSRGD